MNFLLFYVFENTVKKNEDYNREIVSWKKPDNSWIAYGIWFQTHIQNSEHYVHFPKFRKKISET